MKVENTAEVREKAKLGRGCAGVDMVDFIERYMKSRTRALIDEGQAYVSTMDEESLFDYFLKNDKYKKTGKRVRRIRP